jgi:hypothetical protein
MGDRMEVAPGSLSSPIVNLEEPTLEEMAQENLKEGSVPEAPV